MRPPGERPYTLSSRMLARMEYMDMFTACARNSADGPGCDPFAGASTLQSGTVAIPHRLSHKHTQTHTQAHTDTDTHIHAHTRAFAVRHAHTGERSGHTHTHADTHELARHATRDTHTHPTSSIREDHVFSTQSNACDIHSVPLSTICCAVV